MNPASSAPSLLEQLVGFEDTFPWSCRAAISHLSRATDAQALALAALAKQLKRLMLATPLAVAGTSNTTLEIPIPADHSSKTACCSPPTTADLLH